MSHRGYCLVCEVDYGNDTPRCPCCGARDVHEEAMQELVNFMASTGLSMDHLPAFQRLVLATYDAGAAGRQAEIVTWMRSVDQEPDRPGVDGRAWAAAIEARR